jgi:hypothetical protein
MTNYLYRVISLLVILVLFIPLIVNLSNSDYEDEGQEFCEYLGYEEVTDYDMKNNIWESKVVFECDQKIVWNYDCYVKETVIGSDKWGDKITSGYGVNCDNMNYVFGNWNNYDQKFFSGKNNWYWGFQ